MGRYDYLESVCDDIRFWLDNEADNFKAEHANDRGEWLREDNRNEIAEELREILWTNDSVTGNGSGSYTVSSWTACENLCYNFDLLAEAVEEFGGGCDILKDGPEACDVTIRCYLLPRAIDTVLDEMMN